MMALLDDCMRMIVVKEEGKSVNSSRYSLSPSGLSFIHCDGGFTFHELQFGQSWPDLLLSLRLTKGRSWRG
jgi:hypothetical protein